MGRDRHLPDFAPPSYICEPTSSQTPPFDRRLGDKPVLDDAEIDDLI
jgi:hypothetical protein